MQKHACWIAVMLAAGLVRPAPAHQGKIDWKQTADAFLVTLPEKKPCEHAYVLKIGVRPAARTPVAIAFRGISTGGIHSAEAAR
jgi:hypothetical protein